MPATVPGTGAAAPDSHRAQGRHALGSRAAYLKDPFLWPGIYRLNTDVVEDPHWIYPGEVLRIAPATTSPLFPPMTTPPPVPPWTTPPPPQPADTTPMLGGDDSTETLARGPQQPSLAETESDDRAPLFQSTKARTVAEILKAYTDQPYRPLRPSEFYSSGFLTENQRLPYGKVLGPVTPQQIKATNSRANALPYTTIAIAAPRGATYEVGDTLLVASARQGDRALWTYRGSHRPGPGHRDGRWSLSGQRGRDVWSDSERSAGPAGRELHARCRYAGRADCRRRPRRIARRLGPPGPEGAADGGLHRQGPRERRCARGPLRGRGAGPSGSPMARFGSTS